MKLKIFVSILPITVFVLSTTLLVAQERSPSPRSFSVSGFSWPSADIDSLREASRSTFSILDTNENGSISLDELDITQELVEGEETLPAEELQDLRQRSNIISRTFMNRNLDEEIDQFKVADTNQDGTLSKTEFELLEATVRTYILQTNLESFDQDNNGSIEQNEFSAHLENIEELDADGDGSISREELKDVADQRLILDVRVNQRESIGQDRRATESRPQEQRNPSR